MIIRPAQLKELPALSDLCLRSKGMWNYDPAFLEGCRAPLTIHPEDLHAGYVMVAEEDEQVLGVVHLTLLKEEADLDKLFVDPTAAGKGVGAILLNWALETARAKGAKSLSFAADPFAESFYRKFGAQRVGLIPSEVDPERALPHMTIAL